MKEIASVDVAEIEVTPEMILGGVCELACFNSVEDSWATRAEIVKEIYSAMARAMPTDKATTT